MTAAVGALVKQYLDAAGMETRLLQSDSLSGISATSNAWGSDLFVSIHCNSADTSAAKGTETYRYPGSTNGAKLAGCIQAQILDALGTVDRGVKEASFSVLRNTDCTAVLVELAFISNAEDAAILRDRQDDFSRAIARGVTDYISGGTIKAPVETSPAPKINPASGMLSEHFAKNEFSCHCGCGAGGDKMHPRLIELLELLHQQRLPLPGAQRGGGRREKLAARARDGCGRGEAGEPFLRRVPMVCRPAALRRHRAVPRQHGRLHPRGRA